VSGRGRVVVVATIVVLCAGAWWLWPDSRSAPNRPGLTLLVNARSRIELTPGTPLELELSLGSSRSSSGFDVGSRFRPWNEFVRVEAIAGEATMPFRLVRVGPPRSVHVLRKIDGSPTVTEDSRAVAHLERGRHVHTVTFVAAPEQTAAAHPGTYRMRGVLDVPRWMPSGWRGRAVSPLVTVVVVDPSKAGQQSEQLEAERLARTSAFYLNAGRFGDALDMATKLAALRPRESRSFTLLGDAAAGLNRLTEALEAYRRAMALLPRSYEEPTMLLQRIRDVVVATRQHEHNR
jgi:hypothetical protein